MVRVIPTPLIFHTFRAGVSAVPGDHARPRALRRAPRAALWTKQVHRRGADEYGRGGRAPRDRQTRQQAVVQERIISPGTSGRRYY
jgi:hypothetical protein